MDLGLTGKVALVAGGSAGIGYEIARDLVREGATVSICGRDPGRLKTAQDELGVSSRQLDVRDAAAVGDWVEETAADHGALHVVVTNAGGPPAGPTGDFDLDGYRAALELGMLAHIGLVQAALPHLKRAGWGRVLMVASETVRQPIPEFALSNIVRPGLVGYAKTLVRELGAAGITVNVLAPGYTATAALSSGRTDPAARSGNRPADRPDDRPSGRTAPPADGLPPRSEDERIAAAAGIPLGRVARPDEVAAAGVFLLSERAGFISGTVQVVDGGRAMGV